MFYRVSEVSGAHKVSDNKWSSENGLVQFELEPAIPENLSGRWVLIRGHLEREGAAFSATLTVESNAKTSKYELPVSLKGNLLEVVKLPAFVNKIYFDPLGSKGSVEFEGLEITPINQLQRYVKMYSRVLPIYYKQSSDRLYKAGMYWYLPLTNLNRAYSLSGGFRAYSPQIPYQKWISRFDELDARDTKKIGKAIKRLSSPVEFDVLSFDTNCDTDSLKLHKQLYPYFKVNTPQGISNDWVLCCEAGVELREHALFWFSDAVQANPDAIGFYSDHDTLAANGERHTPCFKPDFSPELLLSDSYVGSVLLVRRTVLDEYLTTRTHSDLSCYQLALFCLSKIQQRGMTSQFIHIPAVLYHVFEGNSFEGMHSARLFAVKEHLRSQGIKADVASLNDQYHKVVYEPISKPLISIIIPTRDTLHHLERSVRSVLEQSTYRNFEIIIADNQSVEPETHAFFDSLSEYSNVKVIPYDFPFNYSSINNFAIKHSTGEVILLLNNDTEVISSNWLEVMLGQLQQPNVGAVGVKLLFGDRRVQHAGDAVGPGGCADHFHSRLGEDEPGYMGRAILAQDLSAVTAACLMVTRAVWDQLGGLDEKNLAVAFNDVDFCLRVREAGLRVVYTPYAKLYHHESVSRGKDDSPEKAARAKREADYMRKRWSHVMSHDPFYNPNLNYSRPDFTLSHVPMVDKPWLKKR